MTEHVILLHGVWMRGLTLVSLARRLRMAGYRVDVFDYASVFGDAEATRERLRDLMRTSYADRVHLVGHSLGGIVALEATRGARGLPDGNIVCLGPPLRGSAVARVLASMPGGTFLLGSNRTQLVDGVERWNDVARHVGVIAGAVPFGIGAGFAGLGASHDGTVAVDETRLDGITDHRTIAATHTGLLFSPVAADLAIAFLRNARFDQDGTRARASA